ncbi:MAG TPA: FAD-dependent oxidoreductase [Thermoanaerobaculia bacterium]|jgi:gamma-glutamylputrescine oxidase|nr:FAD-dependent oxidoreductase [Thermoanaerobaculia bacterium]
MTSIWSEIPAPTYPALAQGTTRADVAIIGGGMAGLSAAYHLLESRPGAKVVVLEADRLGAGASGRTTGMVGPGVGQSFASLVKRLGPGKAQALYRATLKAVEYVRDFVAAEGIDCELEMSGQVVVARSKGGRARLVAQAALFDSCGLPYEALDDQALDRCIHLAPRPAHGSDRGPAALKLPTAGILHPMKLIAGMAERVTARGGRIFEGARVTKVSDGRPVRVEVHGGGEVIADDVVAATAGYTPEIGLLHGRILPVHLQVLVTERLTDKAREAIGWKGREGMLDARRVFNYFRLTADDRIVFGGGAPRYRWGGNTNDGGGASASAALERLGAELAETFPSDAKVAVAKGWTGVIGYVADAIPAIQRSKRNSSVLHVVGWCGHGVALAVASGQWVSALICDGAAKEDLPWFRNDLPLIPSELARWVGFQSSVRMMSLLDRIS